MSSFVIHPGHVLDSLRAMPAASVHCVVTSPPYWALRDYGLPPSKWGDGWEGCLGLEPDPRAFVAHLVEVFDEVKRVLRDDGTLWLNLGDSYSRGGRKTRARGDNESALSTRTEAGKAPSLTTDLAKEKELMGCDAIGLELNQAYIEIAKRRIDQRLGLLVNK